MSLREMATALSAERGLFDAAATDPAAARGLMDRADATLRSRSGGVLAVTAYRESGVPLAWSGRPSELSLERVAGPAALFVVSRAARAPAGLPRARRRLHGAARRRGRRRARPFDLPGCSPTHVRGRAGESDPCARAGTSAVTTPARGGGPRPVRRRRTGRSSPPRGSHRARQAASGSIRLAARHRRSRPRRLGRDADSVRASSRPLAAPCSALVSSSSAGNRGRPAGGRPPASLGGSHGRLDGPGLSERRAWCPSSGAASNAR